MQHSVPFASPSQSDKESLSVCVHHLMLHSFLNQKKKKKKNDTLLTTCQ